MLQTGDLRETGEDVTADIAKVLERRAAELMKIDGVEGVGQALCDGAPCIRVYIVNAAAQSRVPSSLEGIRVTTVVTGTFQASPADTSAY